MKKFVSKRNVLILLVPFLYFAAWNRGLNLLYVMASLLSGLLFISYILSRFSIIGIDIRRDGPKVANEDDEIVFKYTAINKSFLPRFIIEVEDNLRWLDTPLKVLFGKIKSKGIAERICNVQASLRGYYTLGPISTKSSMPLGLFPVKKKNEDLQKLLVYPKVFEIDYIPLIGASSMPMVGIETMSRAGTSQDFYGTREYQKGDSIRYIHWPSTARHGKFIVKEFELNTSTEVNIILDSMRGVNVGRGKESSYEYAIKVAASVANYSIKRANMVSFTSQGINIQHGKGIQQLSYILEALAKIKPDRKESFHGIIYESTKSMKDGATAVIIFPMSNMPISNFYQSFALLRAKYIKIIAIVIDETSFFKDERHREEDVLASTVISNGGIVYSVRKGDNISKVFNETF